MRLRFMNMTENKALKNAKAGWILNPNKKIVDGIIRGISRNNGNCPCANTSVDKRCPCSNYRENDYCCCTLYVKQ